jgi:hypothetical protein
LELNIGHGSAGRLNVRGDITLLGGTLHVIFEPGCTPVAGSIISVISGRDELRGRFKSVTVDGRKATPFYIGGYVLLRMEE